MTTIWKESIENIINEKKEELYSKSEFIENGAYYYLLGLKMGLYSCGENELAEEIKKIIDDYLGIKKS